MRRRQLLWMLLLRIITISSINFFILLKPISNSSCRNSKSIWMSIRTTHDWWFMHLGYCKRYFKIKLSIWIPHWWVWKLSSNTSYLSNTKPISYMCFRISLWRRRKLCWWYSNSNSISSLPKWIQKWRKWKLCYLIWTNRM